MKNNDTGTSFEQQYKEKCTIRSVNESSIVAIIFGIVMLFYGAFKAMCTIGLLCILFNLFACFGVVLIAFGAFFPLLLKKPLEQIRNVLSYVGRSILKIFLIPIYLFMSLINLFKHKKYEKLFVFSRWEDESTVESSFSDYKKYGAKSGRFAVLDVVQRVLVLFASYKMYVFLPVVIVLIFLGAILFFASSNAVFSFVYTLF